jgi:hypothetical protein
MDSQTHQEKETDNKKTNKAIKKKTNKVKK